MDVHPTKNIAIDQYPSMVYTLWWTNILLWKITIFNGKIHYKWPCSIAMLVHQRVNGLSWHRIILQVDPTAIPRATPQALLSGAWSLTSRTSQARTTLPRALEVPMDSVGRQRMVEKSTINGGFYGNIHYKIYVFNGKIHYKWKCLQENPL